MPGIEDWLNCPLQIVQSLFDQTGENHSKKVKDYFQKRISERNAKFWIPSLNDVPLHELKSGSLVRFRCMVQDMYDTEFYMGVYEVQDQKTGETRLKCGQFCDVAQCGKTEELKMDSQRTKMMDRQTMYCIPVPGENQWVKEAYSSQSQYRTSSANSNSSASRMKRPLETESDGMETESAPTPEDSTETEAETEAKRSKTENDSESDASKTPDLNFPIPGEKGPACLLKVYDGLDSFKVNEVLEVVGVLSVDPAMASTGDKGDEQSALLDPESEGMDTVEEQAHSPPPSLVPRVHAILVEKQSHQNPLLPSVVDTQEQQVKDFMKEVCNVREELLAVLKQAVLGDALTAQLLLCHLLSTVYARQDVVAVGKFSLNISKVPQSSKLAQNIYTLVEQLVTKSHFIPLTLDKLNGTKFLPHKDYSANRLSTGRLQLSDHTHVVLDETAMQPGQLDVTGVKNLRALGNVISWQKVEYDFSFHKQDFRCDLPVLVLSEGKSLLTCDGHVPLSLSSPSLNVEEQYKGIEAYLTPALLTKLRMYLTLVSSLPYSLPDDLQKDIEQDFVDKRRDDTKNMTIENFQSLLVLARLLSLSHGHSTLKKEVWERAKSLDAQCKQRLQSAQAAAT